MSYISLILGSIFVSNLLLNNFFGINPILSSEIKVENIINLGLSMALILIASNLITKLVNDFLLVKFNIEYLRLFIFVVLIGIFVEILVSLFINLPKKVNKTTEELKTMIGVNSLILGSSFIIFEKGYTILETIAYSIGVSAGFVLMLILVSSIAHKYRNNNMPKSFKGEPTLLLAMGLIALAFAGFKGLI